MFKTVTQFNGNTTHISDGDKKYLHSDGSITSVAEYFEIPTDAQRILDKYYPRPKHIWKHGDVFRNCLGIWIYLKRNAGAVTINLERTNSDGTPEHQLTNAKFLFNIKGKI